MAEEVKSNVSDEPQGTGAPVSASDNANSFDAIVASISKLEDTKMYRAMKVRNVTVDINEDDIAFVNFVVDRPVRSNVNTDAGWTIGEIKVVRVSIFAVSAVLKENELTAILANDIVRHPNIAEKLLSGATISILQRMVKANEEYVNPFTTKDNVVPVVYDHNWFANYVTSIELGAFGKAVIDKLAGAMVAQLMSV